MKVPKLQAPITLLIELDIVTCFDKGYGNSYYKGTAIVNKQEHLSFEKTYGNKLMAKEAMLKRLLEVYPDIKNRLKRESCFVAVQHSEVMKLKEL